MHLLTTPKHSEGGLAKAGRLSRAERICGRHEMNRGNFFRAKAAQRLQGGGCVRRSVVAVG
jgi:hypothetical protein